MTDKIDDTVLQRLANTDTPTVCNAIELAQGRRGFNAFTRGRYATMHNTAQVAMGFARTAQIAAEQPPQRSVKDNQRIRMDYYRYMSEGARPAICVIEDTDTEPVGAFWGEVNTNVHRGFGISGTLTNGVIRDIGVCPKDYQVIGGLVGPSHRFVHIEAIGVVVTVFGLTIHAGDFVHADRHGACVIPPEILPDIDQWIQKMQALEAIVIAPTQTEDFNFERFEKAWCALERQRV